MIYYLKAIIHENTLNDIILNTFLNFTSTSFNIENDENNFDLYILIIKDDCIVILH